MATNPTAEIDSQPLAAYFATPGNRDLRKARRLLLLAIDAVAARKEPIGNLSAESLRVSGDVKNPRLAIDPLPAERAEFYEDPEHSFSPWKENQYALGKSFYLALSGQVGAVPLQELVPELGGSFSGVIAKMTDRDPKKRFPLAKDALRVVRGLTSFNFLRLLLLLAGGFVLLACATIAYTLDPSFSWICGITHRCGGPQAEPRPVPASREGMVYVQGGAVILSAKSINVEPFYLDAGEVTVAKYEAFARAKGKPLPFGENADYSRDFPHHPVWNVSWRNAADYCASDSGKRLPTEPEWQRALDTAGYALGTGTPPEGQVNVNTGTLSDVGASAGDKTRSGILDLAGNLPEWTADDFAPSSPWKAVRGGGYYLPASLVRERLAIAPEPDSAKGLLRVGFRCAVR